MALSLEQYASYLDTRADLPWPAAPQPKQVKARPHLVRLRDVRAVMWNVYGTLLCIPPTGELLFEHPQPFIMSNALDRTIQEFKMWASMSRKPGQPSEYLQQIYKQLLAEQLSVPGGTERHPEVAADRLWEAILKPWVTRAAALILEEAGGKVTGMDGQTWDPDAGHILATNGLIHDEMLRVLAFSS